ncbi:MAG: hypothetical protein V1921_05075 [Candidatus Altiarchaeota archaeon]
MEEVGSPVVKPQSESRVQHKPKNPHVAAFLGLLFGPIAYLYVWKIGRGLIFLMANLALSYYFGIPGSLAAGVIISYDCWRIAVLENKEATVKKKETIISNIESDIRCPKCKISLALSYPKCPNCRAQLSPVAI